jgi:tetratricopeptide (TPR) repeat protein
VAGNRRAYESAVKRAANLAWEKKWTRAAQEYTKALDEYPQDVAALTGLGLACAETRQLDKALDMYKRAANLSPDNPEVIQRVGQVFERMAQWPDAARAYMLAADAHLRLRNVSQAMELWRQAARLDPGNPAVHRNLAQAYQNQGDHRRAARQHLIMARVLEQKQDIRQAIEHCNTALKLDPRNTEAQEIREALRRGQPLPDGPTARLQPDAEGKRTLDSFVVFEEIEMGGAALLDDKDRASPADMLREHLLTQMVEALFSDDADPEMMQVNLLLGQAVDFQTRGLVDRAIDTYTNVLRMGTETPAIHFNLGLLHLEKRDFTRAIEHLNQTLSNPDYALGAHFAIGQGYQAWNKTTDALQHLLHVLEIVDLQTVHPDQIEAIRAAYEQFYQQYAEQDHTQEKQHLVQSIISLLSSRGWGQQLIQAREQLNDLAGGSILTTLAEVFTEPEAEKAMTSMRNIHTYLKQGMLFTALEECFWAIQQAPFYLPLHLRMADILIGGDRLDEAVNKYITVAETYKERGALRRAIAIFRKALEIAPMDIGVREHLIDMLIAAQMIDQAIEQYIAVADAYYQLAQIDRAIEKYEEALRYAGRGDPSRHWESNILHRIGDIHIQRVDSREAIKAYRRIKRMHAKDEKARTYLVDLYFRTGQRDAALRELDELIEFHKTKRQPRKMLSILQDVVRPRPKELALHMRLAKAYLDMRMKQEAIAELDIIGELQLEANMPQEAVRTIQAIIRLGPENVQGYQQLLAQLKR